MLLGSSHDGSCKPTGYIKLTQEIKILATFCSEPFESRRTGTASVSPQFTKVESTWEVS